MLSTLLCAGIMYINSVNMQFPPTHGDATGLFIYKIVSLSCTFLCYKMIKKRRYLVLV